MSNTLSLELLASIFLICVRDCQIPPERLTWVCERWRRLALDLPKLWADVYYGCTEDIPRMSVFLERSCTAPLSVELRVTCTELADDTSAIRLASMLEHHFYRIQSLHLVQHEGWRTVECPVFDQASVFWDGVNRLFRLINDDVAALRNFLIFPLWPCDAVLPAFLEDARLQVLAAENISFNGIKKAFGASSETLVSLRVSFIETSDFPIENFISALAALQHLRQLEVELPKKLKQSTKTNPLILPALSSLVTRGNTTVLLSRLVCHSLRIASVEMSEAIPEIGPLVTFLNVHAKTIGSLDLSRIANEPASLGVPSVRPIPFPCLSSLSGVFDNHSSSSILGMIKGPCLTSVDISLYWTISIGSILDFFDAASSTLRTARLRYGNKHGEVSGSSTDPTPLDGRIVFGCLEYFESWCRLGDVVISATKEAPKLKMLQLHGPLNTGDPEHPSWVIAGAKNKFGRAELPSLQSLIMLEFSIPLIRISAPALRNLTICSVHSGSEQLDEPVRMAIRNEVVRFILESRESLEMLQLPEPLCPDAPSDAWSQFIELRTFPRLTSISLCPGDNIAKMIQAPSLLHLEIRHPTKGISSDWRLDYGPLATAETLVIASAFHPESLCEALRNMKNVHHLQIRVDTELGPTWEEVKFLRSLAAPLQRQGSAPCSDCDWLFPKLRSIDLHFALWAEDYRLQDPVRLPDGASGEDVESDVECDEECNEECDKEPDEECDEEPDEECDEEFDVSSDSSDPADYSDSDDVELGGNHITQDIDRSGSKQAASLGDSMTVASESSDKCDRILQAARQPWGTFETPPRGMLSADTRPEYGHFLGALQAVISARRCPAHEVSPLHSLKISAGRKMYHGFSLPEELQSWFKANLDAFEAPK